MNKHLYISFAFFILFNLWAAPSPATSYPELLTYNVLVSLPMAKQKAYLEDYKNILFKQALLQKEEPPAKMEMDDEDLSLESFPFKNWFFPQARAEEPKSSCFFMQLKNSNPSHCDHAYGMAKSDTNWSKVPACTENEQALGYSHCALKNSVNSLEQCPDNAYEKRSDNSCSRVRTNLLKSQWDDHPPCVQGEKSAGSNACYLSDCDEKTTPDPTYRKVLGNDKKQYCLRYRNEPVQKENLPQIAQWSTNHPSGTQMAAANSSLISQGQSCPQIPRPDCAKLSSQPQLSVQQASTGTPRKKRRKKNRGILAPPSPHNNSSSQSCVGFGFVASRGDDGQCQHRSNIRFSSRSFISCGSTYLCNPLVYGMNGEYDALCVDKLSSKNYGVTDAGALTKQCETQQQQLAKSPQYRTPDQVLNANIPGLMETWNRQRDEFNKYVKDICESSFKEVCERCGPMLDGVEQANAKAGHCSDSAPTGAPTGPSGSSKGGVAI